MGGAPGESREHCVAMGDRFVARQGKRAANPLRRLYQSRSLQGVGHKLADTDRCSTLSVLFFPQLWSELPAKQEYLNADVRLKDN